MLYIRFGWIARAIYYEVMVFFVLYFHPKKNHFFLIEKKKQPKRKEIVNEGDRLDEIQRKQMLSDDILTYAQFGCSHLLMTMLIRYQLYMFYCFV